MRVLFRTFRPANQAYALIMVMIFLAIALLVLGSVMLWTTSSSKDTHRNNAYYASQYAAEAAVEQVVAQMNRDYLYQNLNPASTYSDSTNLPSQSGWPVAFQFSDPTNKVANQTYVNIPSPSSVLTPLTSQEAGLQGFVRNCTVASTATPQGQLYNTPATVVEQVQYADVPVFQFAIFYNMNLEIDPGASMTVTGPVFSNAGIWAGNANLTFQSSVTAVGIVSTAQTDPFSKNYTGSPTPTFDSTITTNHAALTMPIGASTGNNSPTNVEAILQFPPSDYALGSSAAYTTNGQVYFANQADLIITNVSSSSWTNISVFWQDGNQASPIARVANDLFVIKTNISGTNKFFTVTTTNGAIAAIVTNVVYSGYSFVTNASFYDYRESNTVEAIQINVTNLDVWVTNTISGKNGGGSINSTILTDKGHNIDSIYVYNNATNSSTILPAVRLVNGAKLPTSSGLAVATPQPIYVQGNFNITDGSGNSAATANTSHTFPAALYADALTELSPNWSDSWTASTGLSSGSPNRTVPSGTTMTVNAATLEGIVPTVNTISSGTPGAYSGGTENFVRFLENWGNATDWYNGSIVVMFPSKYATNYWQQTGNYYNPPARKWGFDTNFANGKLPPMAPRTKAIIRLGWNP